MCSAKRHDASAEPADSGRAAIVRSAIDLFGREGVSGTTVRAVAEQAGVSAPLIIHHFGSKQGLVDACDEHVRSIVEAFVESGQRGSFDIQTLLAEPDLGTAWAYVARSLQSGGPVGEWWFDEVLRIFHEALPAMVEHGHARQLDDPEMAALLMMAMDLGLLLLRPHVERRLDGDLTDPAVLDRWLRTGLDLMTHGFLLEPGEDER